MSYPQGQWQPGWPPPQQFAPPMPPPRKKRTGLVVGMVAALVVVIAGTAAALLVVGREQAVPQPQVSNTVEAEVAAPKWTANFTGGKYQRDTELLGSWSTKDLVVRGQQTSVVAYQASNGEVAWQLPTDKVRYCGMSTVAAEGLGVVTFGGPKPGNEKVQLCNKIQAIDLATGAPKWTKESRPDTDEFAPELRLTAVRPEIAGATVIALASTDVIGLDLKTGEKRWQYRASEHNPISKGKGRDIGPCTVSSWIATPTRVAFEQACSEKAFEIGGDHTVVTAIDPKTGQKQWSTAVPTSIIAAGRGPQTPVPHLISAEPPVLFLDRSMSKDGPYALLPFDNNTGAVGKEIELPGWLAMKEGRETDRAPVTLVKGNTIVTVISGEANGGCDHVRGVYAIDVPTGKALWPKPKALGCDLSLMGIDGDTVVALSAGSPEEAPSVYRVQLTDGSEQHGQSLPQDPGGGTLAGAVHRVGDNLVVLPYLAERREHSAVALVATD